MYFLKDEKIDYVDPMVPISENWIKLIEEIYKKSKHKN